MEQRGGLEMKREWVKTLILIGLVITSVLFTWNLWTYQTRYQTYVKAPSPQNVSIASSFKLNKVVKPSLFIYNNHSRYYYGTIHRSDIDSMYNKIRGAMFDHITLPKVDAKNLLPEQGNNPDYEFIFPSPITKPILTKIFNFDSQRISQIDPTVKVDRVAFYKSIGPSSNIIAVFKLGNKTQFYTMIDDATIFNNLQNDTTNLLKNNNLMLYFKTNSLKNKDIYLPAVVQKIRDAYYVYVKEDPYKFVEAYFSDPENVYHSSNMYFDADHQLKVKGQVILYINPSNDIQATEKDPILKSFNYINGHSGWTDNFIYESVLHDNTQGTSEVIFRMEKGDYPVYSTGSYPYDYAAEIALKWQSGYLHQIGRTLLNLNAIEVPDTYMSIDSGQQILEKLVKDDQVKLKNIQNLSIGYSLNPFEQSGTLHLTPTWFYEENNQWNSVDSLNPQQNSQINKMQGGK